MIQWNDYLRQRALDSFCRLDSLVLRETDPDTWNVSVSAEALNIARRFRAAKGEDRDEFVRLLVDSYRLAYRARVWRAPKEFFFWLLCARLHVEAHVGPDALLHQNGYLGPLWDRLEAIHKRHRWPKEDENGDPWNPEDHLAQVPDDYAAWLEEFERVADGMENAALRAVCRMYGVPEIADLKENDPAEFERRFDIGHEYASKCHKDVSDEGLPGTGDYTSNRGDDEDGATS